MITLVKIVEMEREACEAQLRSWPTYLVESGEKVTVEEIQRQCKDIKEKSERIRREAEIKSNPHYREITDNLRKIHSVEGGVICPQCGETDSHGNTSEGKPFCYKCQLIMISKEKAENWIKPIPPKKFQVRFDEPDGVVRIKK